MSLITALIRLARQRSRNSESRRDSEMVIITTSILNSSQNRATHQSTVALV